MVAKHSIPTFSVVIPTYNRCNVILETVQAVLNQTFSSFEVVVVDNGSTDHTSDIIRSISDSRVRYLKLKGSGSPASPRNHGIVEARGEWIAFLDSDDYWFPEKLESVANVLEKEDCDLISHFQEIRDTRTNKVIEVMGYSCDAAITYEAILRSENCFATSSIAIRRQFITNRNLHFNESVKYFAVEDYDLWLRVLANGGKAIFLNKILGVNNVSEGHMGVPELVFKNMFELLKDHAHNVQKFTDQREDLENELISALHMRQAVLKLRMGEVWASMAGLKNAIVLRPLSPMSYFFFRLRQRFGLDSH